MAANIKGITVEIGANTTKLNQALRSVSTSANKLKTELNQVEKGLKMNPGNVDLVRQKQTLLAKEINGTKYKLNEMKRALKTASENGATEKNSASFRKLQREIQSTENELKGLQRQAAGFNSFNANVMAAAGRVSALGNKLQKAGAKLRGVSTALTIAGGLAASVGAEFDTSMSKVQAVSGATGKDFDKLRDKAREMGAKTKFSASEAAEALNYMAMAGWKTNDMLAGIEGVMNLAAASGEDLATTSDIVTDALTALGYSAGDSGRLADVMAAASSNANTNVGMMGETFKYAAAVAGSMGYSMEDVALATGLMANAGIKASQAGTSLRSIISRLAAPTGAVSKELKNLGVSITDSSGEARPFRDVMEDLRQKMSGMSKTQKTAVASTLAGKNAMSGFLAIINASDKDFNKLTNAIDNSSGAAENMAETMIDNFGGQLTILKSQLQELAISVSDTVTPALKSLTSMVQSAVGWYNNLSDGTKRVVVAMAGMAAAAGPLLSAMGLMMSPTTKLLTVIGKLKAEGLKSLPALYGMKTVLGALLTPMGAAAAAAAVAAGAIALACMQTNRYTRENNKFLQSCQQNIQGSTQQAGAAQIYADEIAKLSKVENKSAAQKALMAQYVEKLNGLMPGLNLTYDQESDKLNKSTTAIYNNIKALRAKALAEAYATNAQKVANRMADQQFKIQQKQDKISSNKTKMQTLDQESAKYQKLASDNAKLQNEILQLNGALGKNEKKFKQWNSMAEGVSRSQAFDEISRKAKKAGIDIPKGLSEGMKSGKTEIPKSLKSLKKAVTQFNTEKQMKMKGKASSKGYAHGLKSGLVPAKLVGGKLVGHAASGAGRTGGMRSSGSKGGNAYRQGMAKLNGSLRTTGKNLGENAKKGAGSVRLNKTGSNLSEGLKSGILSVAGRIAEAAASVVRNAKKAADKAAASHSPSRLFAETGRNISAGLAMGIMENQSMVEKAASSMISAANGQAPSVSGASSYKSTNYSIGNVTVDVSDLKDMATVEDFVDVLKRAKSFA